MIRRIINRVRRPEPSAPVSIFNVGLPPAVEGTRQTRYVHPDLIARRRAANRRARASRKRNR